MKGQASWMWFMFGLMQLFLGTHLPPELQLASTVLNTNGVGFLVLAVIFLFIRDKREGASVSRKAERTTLVRGEDGQTYEVPIATRDSKFTLVLNIIWFVALMAGWVIVWGDDLVTKTLERMMSNPANDLFGGYYPLIRRFVIPIVLIVIFILFFDLTGGNLVATSIISGFFVGPVFLIENRIANNLVKRKMSE